MTDEEQKHQERNRLLGGCIPGERLLLECSDNKTRRVRIIDRTEFENSGTVFGAKGHGTEYEMHVPSCEYDAVELEWPTGYAFVVGVKIIEQSNELWSDTSASDIGVPDL